MPAARRRRLWPGTVPDHVGNACGSARNHLGDSRVSLLRIGTNYGKVNRICIFVALRFRKFARPEPIISTIRARRPGRKFEDQPEYVRGSACCVSSVRAGTAGSAAFFALRVSRAGTETRDELSVSVLSIGATFQGRKRGGRDRRF